MTCLPSHQPWEYTAPLTSSGHYPRNRFLYKFQKRMTVERKLVDEFEGSKFQKL